jgi:hypothetical protein
MSRRFVWPSLERARNAVASLWSRLEARTAFGMRRDDLDELRRRLDEANQHVTECDALVTGWTELAGREIGGRELLKTFEADLKEAVRAKDTAEAALKRRLRDIFIGAKGHPPTSDQELTSGSLPPRARPRRPLSPRLYLRRGTAAAGHRRADVIPLLRRDGLPVAMEAGRLRTRLCSFRQGRIP